MMDVDPAVLSAGSVCEGQWCGAEVCEGASFASVRTAETGPTLIVDGDLCVDGVFENLGLTLVKGNLVARAVVCRSTYLLVLGDLRASAFVGLGENYGTYVVGDAVVDRAALLGNHHMGVVGTFACDDWAHDECHSHAEVASILSGWGQSDTKDGFDLAAVRSTLAALPMPIHDPARSRVDFVRTTSASERAMPGSPDAFADLRSWIGEFSGNQRQLLAALRQDWKEGLATRDLEEVARILRKSIKSPKLRTEREEYLAELGFKPTA